MASSSSHTISPGRPLQVHRGIARNSPCGFFPMSRTGTFTMFRECDESVTLPPIAVSRLGTPWWHPRCTGRVDPRWTARVHGTRIRDIPRGEPGGFSCQFIQDVLGASPPGTPWGHRNPKTKFRPHLRVRVGLFGTSGSVLPSLLFSQSADISFGSRWTSSEFVSTTGRYRELNKK